MSAAVVRMLEAAEWMRLEATPFHTAVGDWLTRVAMDAAKREPFQAPDVRWAFLTTGERADAIRAAETYLTAVREGATP